MERYVDIAFDCIPLRSVVRLDPPLDASPGLVAKYDRIKGAIAKHGTYNTYYLHNATCKFHVTNSPDRGMIAFKFEGVAFTDENDERTKHADLSVMLDRETCPWLEQHVVRWFSETVVHAVIVEFDKYIGVGDSERTKQRREQLDKSIEKTGGYLGMHL
jgi:hypothetical protein